MAYQSVVGRDTKAWIHHFQQQATGSHKTLRREGLILVSPNEDASKEKPAVPIQNVSGVQQGVEQAAAQLQADKKKSIKRRTAFKTNHLHKKPRRTKKVKRRGTNKSRSNKGARKYGNKQKKDIFSKRK